MRRTLHRLIAAAVLALLAINVYPLLQPVDAAVTRVQGFTSDVGAIWSGDGIEVSNFGVNVTSGNCVTAVIVLQGRTVTTVASSNATWVEDFEGATALDSGTVNIAIWSARATGAFTAVTTTISSATGAPGGVVIEEWNDCPASGYFGGSSSFEAASGTTHDSGNITNTGEAHAWIVGASVNVDTLTYTEDADFTASQTDPGGNSIIGYKVLSAVATHSRTVTSSGNADSWNAIAWYKGVNAAAGGSNQGMLRGVFGLNLPPWGF